MRYLDCKAEARQKMHFAPKFVSDQVNIPYMISMLRIFPYVLGAYVCSKSKDPFSPLISPRGATDIKVHVSITVFMFEFCTTPESPYRLKNEIAALQQH